MTSASVIRDEYFNYLNDNGVVYPASGNMTKPAIGNVSPGCQRCIAGTWCCIFVTGDCTKKCFFCPSTQSECNRHINPYVPEGIIFSSVHGCLEYLDRFEFEGVSFSGGEPLLAIDKVLEYITGIRRWFGNKHHIWAYTNGDLITEDMLLHLKQAGLDELRFDIAANNYDLTAVTKAVEFIDTVTVEIPTIPEDKEILKPVLKEMKKIGVKHLNLHQLMRTESNAESLDQRGYSTVNEDVYPSQTPIMESELAALEILKYALDTNLDLPINYCSRCYKFRFQGQAHRRRAAQFSGANPSEQTETGYLKKLVIDGATEEAATIKELAAENEWVMTGEGDKAELIFPLEYFNVLLKENYQKADVIYYEPILARLSNINGNEVLTEIFAGDNVCLYKNIKSRKTLDSIISAFLFNKLFIEKLSIESVIQELLNFYGLNAESGQEIIRDTLEFYASFQEVEYLPNELEPYISLSKQ